MHFRKALALRMSWEDHDHAHNPLKSSVQNRSNMSFVLSDACAHFFAMLSRSCSYLLRSQYSIDLPLRVFFAFCWMQWMQSKACLKSSSPRSSPSRPFFVRSPPVALYCHHIAGLGSMIFCGRQTKDHRASFDASHPSPKKTASCNTLTHTTTPMLQAPSHHRTWGT